MELVQPPSLVIQELKCLNLSKAGMARLSAFPDEAIKYAQAVYLRKIVAPGVVLRDPFAYFVKLCVNYCQERKLEPDRSQADILLDLLGLTREDQPLLGENEPRLEFPTSKELPGLEPARPTRMCQDAECAKETGSIWCENLEHPEADEAWRQERLREKEATKQAMRKEFGVVFPEDLEPKKPEPKVELLGGVPAHLVQDALEPLIPNLLKIKKVILGYGKMSWREFMNIELMPVIKEDRYKALFVLALQDDYMDFAYDRGVTITRESTKLPLDM